MGDGAGCCCIPRLICLYRCELNVVTDMSFKAALLVGTACSAYTVERFL